MIGPKLLNVWDMHYVCLAKTEKRTYMAHANYLIVRYIDYVCLLFLRGLRNPFSLLSR